MKQQILQTDRNKLSRQRKLLRLRILKERAVIKMEKE